MIAGTNQAKAARLPWGMLFLQGLFSERTSWVDEGGMGLGLESRV